MRLTFSLLSASLLLGAVAHPVSGLPRDDVVEGNPASPVRVVIYEDLQCGDSARLRSLLDEKVLPKYGAWVAFVYRDFPLPRHEWARAAAIAARWVYERSSGPGIDIRRQLLSEQDHITPQNLRPWLAEFAARNGLDPRAIVAAIDDPRLSARVDQDRASGAARGVAKVPTIYVGGETFVETIVYEDLARAIDQALK